MTRSIVFALLVFCVGCARSEEAQSSAAGAAAVAATASKIGTAATRAVLNPAAPVEIVADDAVLRRIIAKDKTVNDADIEKLVAGASGTQYAKDFEARSRLPPQAGGAFLQFHSADGKYLGAVQKEQGDYQGQHYVVYEAAVWMDPTEAEAKAFAKDDRLACYQRVAARVDPRRAANYNRERDPEGEQTPEKQVFDEIGQGVNKQGDVRKKGVFCTGG